MAAPPVPSRVAYTCRRSQGPAGGPVAATSVVLMDGVVNLDVFRGLPAVNATFVELVLRVDRKGRTNPITLRDGIELRNRVRS
jgi:hypothetical protein